MKTTKCLFSILLALALGLSLLVPAMAERHPYTPVITARPQRLYFAKVGDTLTLEIEAECPEGFEGELSYVWFVGQITCDNRNYPTFIFNATGQKLELKIEKDMYQRSSCLYISSDITVTYINGNGETDNTTGSVDSYVVPYSCRLELPLLVLRYRSMLALQDFHSWWYKRNIAI